MFGFFLVVQETDEFLTTRNKSRSVLNSGGILIRLRLPFPNPDPHHQIKSSAILYYDYLLTFGEEVRFFWGRKRTNSVTVLFFLNRYVSILGNVPVILQSFRSWDDDVSSFTLSPSFLGGGGDGNATPPTPDSLFV